MDADYGMPRILKRYFIAKAKLKFQELKKEANKTHQSFRELLKKVNSS
jgi:hypothetical protein